MPEIIKSASARSRAGTTVALLREELLSSGFPEDLVQQIIPSEDLSGAEKVRMGTWDVSAADRLLAILYGRRPYVGRPDSAPIPPTAL